MAQPSAPLHSPQGRPDEGVASKQVNLIKNESPVGEHQVESGAAIVEANNNGTSLEKINNNTSMDDNNHPPSLQSSADDDVVMGAAATSSKPLAGGGTHVERSQHENINSADTVAVRTDDATNIASTNSNNEGMPNNPLATNISSNIQSPADVQVGGDDMRQQKIRASIQHRRQLLAWVRESRIACEQSRNNISSGKKKGFVAALSDEHLDEGKEEKSTTQKDGAATKPSSSVGGTATSTSAEEIANYKKISKRANSTIAQQRRKTTNTNTANAAQRDLRRGSSTGKRMSTTATTLANVGVKATADISKTGPTSVVSNGGTVSSSNIASAAASIVKAIPKKAASIGKQIDSLAVQSSLSKAQSSKISTEKISKKARKRAISIKKTGVSTNGSLNNVVGTTFPKSAKAVVPIDNSTKPLTLSSSAVRLRDRRDELTQKLSNLLQKQYSSNSGMKRKVDADYDKSVFSPRKRSKDVKKVAQSSLTKLSSLSEMGTAREASRLPLRRMTQWDCVLEEMRWMASDFIEERKWRVACGKTISSSVKEHYETQKMASKHPRRKSSGTPNKSGSTPTAVKIPSSLRASSAESKKSVDSKSSGRRKMSISDSNPLYIDSSKDDLDHSRKISQLLSLTVSDHWDIVLSKGAFPLTDESYKAGYERFRKVQEKLLGATNDVSVKSHDNDCTPRDPPTLKELNCEEISKRLQNSVDTIDSLMAKSNEEMSKERTLQKYRKAHMSGIDLTNAQLKAVHNIESIWGTSDDTSVAAVLGGDFGIGKTVVGCITLWKNRNAGPQLVLCSPALLLRWKHELSKFDDLIVRVLGHDGSFFRADDLDKTDIGKCDVLICNYSSFIEMADWSKTSSSSQRTPDFVSLILDCRHPSVESGTERTVEINRAEWWNRLVQFMMRFTRMNRVVIEHSWNSIRPAGYYNGESDTLDCKMIATKLAFFYNPALFYSTRGSIGKRVISWAKHQNKLDDKSPSLEMLRSLLATSMSKVFDSALICVKSTEKCQGKLCDGNDLGKISNLSWEIRKCSLTTSQQIEYDHYCSNNMFSFSAGIKERDFAETLLILRRICFHAAVSEVTTSLLGPLLQTEDNQKRSIDGSLIARQSTQISEICVTTAKSLLDKSSKMRELLHVLTRECGHEVPTDLLECLPNEIAPSATQPKKMKVIILATLTEAQLMTSYLLSAVGLHHEVLITFQGRGSSSPVSGACSWAWCQNVISDFNEGHLTDGNNQRKFIDIVVASPITLSSHCCGVGASSADFVISIDEDWSGREELHVVSLLSKFRAGEDTTKMPKSPCKFLKIISKSTCEDTFICKGATVSVDETKSEQAGAKTKSAKKTRKRGRTNSKKNLDEIVKAAVPMNVEYQVVCSGYTNQNGTNLSTDGDGFLLPAGNNGASDPIVFGSKILRHKNSSMSSVFCTQMNTNDLFLPQSDGKISVDEVQLSSALYQSEHDAFCFSASRAILRSITMSRSFAEHSEIHPRDILSSRDVTTAPIRRFATTMSEVRTPNLPVMKESVQLFQPDKSDSSSLKGEKTLESSQKGDSREETETEVDVVDDLSLILYELSSDKLTKIENVQPEEQKIGNTSRESFMNMFSSIFDATAISAELACDGHHWQEASVLAPSFLPPLLDFAQSNVVEASTIPQDNGSSLVATKAREEDSFLANISIMSQLEDIISTSAGQTKHDGNVSARCGDLCSFEKETNPYSFSLNSSVKTHDALSSSLAGCDARGAISCQTWPSMNAMILLTEKKKNKDGTGEQDKNAKKAKNKQFSKSSIEGDKLSMLHFKNEKIMRRATSATKKVKFDDAASILKSVDLHSRINDLVSRSSDSSPSIIDNLLVSGIRKRKHRRLGGIKLPIGVKEPSISSKFSISFEETSDRWSEKEDTLLKEKLAKYGLNWQLVSNAISAAVRSRRSPSQCRHRWESLCDTNPNVPANKIDINRPNDAKMVSNELESLVYITEPSLQTKDSAQKSSITQTALSNWIGNQFPTLRSQTEGNKAEHVASRITKLRETSKKRRYTPMSLLGATNTGAAISVRLASIHPSHAEAVHIARTDVSNGVQPPRKEMWPLELLDYTEKQRKIAAEQTSDDQQRGATNNNHIKQTSQPSHHQSYKPQQPSIPAQHHSSYHPSYDPYRTHHQQPPEGHPSTKGHS